MLDKIWLYLERRLTRQVRQDMALELQRVGVAVGEIQMNVNRLAAAPAPAGMEDILERLAVVERLLSSSSTPTSSRRGNVISDLRTKEWGNKVRL